jgi:hypothetical protein
MYASGQADEKAKVRLDERARTADTFRFVVGCALTSYCFDQSLSPLCIVLLSLCEACCQHRSLSTERLAPYQCSNLTMHPLNRYRGNKPDFAALARKYASFAPLCVSRASCILYVDRLRRDSKEMMTERSWRGSERGACRGRHTSVMQTDSIVFTSTRRNRRILISRTPRR